MDLLRYYRKTGEIVVTTDNDLRGFLADQNERNAIAEFVYQRLYHRYIKPFEYKACKTISIKATGKEVDEYTMLYKNGFSIMANCCLLVETLESFYQGWSNTKGKSEKAFVSFFSRDTNFKAFSTGDLPKQFYEKIRCGILHQGETTGGWTLVRNGNLLFNPETKKINATVFIRLLKKSLHNYRQELNSNDRKAAIWINAIKKLTAILKNTQI